MTRGLFTPSPRQVLLLLGTAVCMTGAFLAPSPTIARATWATHPLSASGAGWRSCAHPTCSATEVKVLTCGRCKATYEVNPSDFGSGRQVKCSNCGHDWYQSAERLQNMPPDMELVEYPAEMKARLDAGKPAEPVSRFRCFVGNLAFTATDDDLRELFERYGTVVSVTVMTDENGRPKGFGFVNMESTVAGAKAVEELDGYELNGRPIAVSEGKQSQSRGGGRGRGRGDGRGGGRGRGRGGGRGARGRGGD